MSKLDHPVAIQVEREYRQRTPLSFEYHQQAQVCLPGGDSRTITFHKPYPLYIQSGEGPHISDIDGNVYADFLGNYTSMIHGHGHPEIVKAITEQARRGTGFAACTPLQVTLAEELCRRVPSIERVRFCNSGTEATMNAVRAARAFTGRPKIVKMEGGYHGTHDLVQVSVAPPLGAAGPADAPSPVPEGLGIPEAILGDLIIISFNDENAAERIFERHGSEIAAVIVEPILGSAGIVLPEPGFLFALRRLCDANDSLLIFDEVITFRLHYGGAQALFSVRPDLTSLGKIIGGGLPVGAFGGRAEVMALYAPPHQRIDQGGTFNANPLTMAAGIAAMELLPHEEILRINELGDSLADGFKSVLEEIQVVAQVNACGSLMALHFTDVPVYDYRSYSTDHEGIHHLVHLSLLNRGVFSAPRGMFAISTPMGKREVEEAISAFADVLAEVRPYIAENAPHLLG